jgi:hypothetical protein
MPNGTYGGVRGWGCEAPAYSILSNRAEVSHLFRATCVYLKLTEIVWFAVTFENM